MTRDQALQDTVDFLHGPLQRLQRLPVGARAFLAEDGELLINLNGNPLIEADVLRLGHDRTALHDLLDRAQSDPDAARLAREVAATLLESGSAPNADDPRLQAFAADVIRGRPGPVRARGRKPKAIRDVLIFRAVNRLLQAGFPLEGGHGLQQGAVDIVAEALTLLREPAGRDAVLKAYQRQRADLSMGKNNSDFIPTTP